MLNPQRVLQRERTTAVTVAVAVDGDKSSQNALKWAANSILSPGQTVTLIHVNPTSSSSSSTKDGIDDWPNEQDPYNQHNDFFLPFRVFCSSKNVHCELITLHDSDVAKALIEYVVLNRIEILVLGSPSKKKNISRLFTKSHVATTVSKGAPDFCCVYVISKGKVTSMRSAKSLSNLTIAESIQSAPQNFNGSTHYVSTLPRCRTTDHRVHDECSVSGSFASSGRLSTDSMLLAFYDNLGSQELLQRARRSTSVRQNDFGSFFSESKSTQFNPMDGELSSSEEETKNGSLSPRNIEHMEEKMRRLELQMKQTMDMYHAACKEALREKQKAKELLCSRKEEENRLKEEQRAKREALEIVEKERAKFKEAVEAANAARRMAEQEAKKSKLAERKALKEAELARMMMLKSLGQYSQSVHVPRNQSLLNILVVISVFYIYSVTRKCIFM